MMESFALAATAASVFGLHTLFSMVNEGEPVKPKKLDTKDKPAQGF